MAPLILGSFHVKISSTFGWKYTKSKKRSQYAQYVHSLFVISIGFVISTSGSSEAFFDKTGGSGSAILLIKFENSVLNCSFVK